MYYLKKYTNDAEYQLYINGGRVLLLNVSYIENDNLVMFNPRTTSGNDDLLNIAGTAIVYDTNISKLKPIAGEEYNTTDYPQDIYVPVGVVIMPASHSEDGQARMMSLKLMGYKTDDNGNITYGSYDASNMIEFDNMGMIAWANPDYDSAIAATENLINYYDDKEEQFPLTNMSVSVSYDENGVNPYVNGGNEGLFYYTNVNITELFSALMGAEMYWISDGDTGYGWNSTVPLSEETYNNLMPSPYNTDGTPNMNMREIGTCMENIHGKKASDMVINYANSSGERFDVFTSTNEYSTEGTNQGEWYVPSPLELSYFSARMKEIYSTINKMNPNFDEVFDTLLGMDENVDGNYLASWASTLYSSSSAWNGDLPINSSNLTVDSDNYVFAVAPVRNL